MSTALAPIEHPLDDKTLFSLVTDGDASKLSDGQKLAYYKARCDVAGLDYRAQPFQFLRLNGKLVLYALKACTDQLAAKHGIRCEILSQATEDGIRIVTVRAIAADGRQTDEIGAVSVKGLAGDNLCNALMKASTKAKRRAILAVCGLGMLDETELDTIPGARAEVADAPVIQMPRRIEKAAEGPQPEAGDESAGSPPPPPPADYDGSLEEQLERSVSNAAAAKEAHAIITREQVVRLQILARENGHKPEAVKAWLARRGIKSSKDLTVEQYHKVAHRLASPEPLEA